MTDLLPTQLKESKLSNSAALRQMIHFILILSSLNLLFIGVVASISQIFKKVSITCTVLIMRAQPRSTELKSINQHHSRAGKEPDHWLFSIHSTPDQQLFHK